MACNENYLFTYGKETTMSSLKPVALRVTTNTAQKVVDYDFFDKDLNEIQIILTDLLNSEKVWMAVSNWPESGDRMFISMDGFNEKFDFTKKIATNYDEAKADFEPIYEK